MIEASHQKVRAEHLRRKAYLYVRQSTMRQVIDHQESTKRQYDLSQRAVALGWPSDGIVVVDEDLGKSGACTDREGFTKLVSEVGMGRAGIVLSLEVSRLARNSSDWHRLLEICAVTGTLILDEEGVYDPMHFNDRLLLGLKGTMSEAELHVIRARLQGGLLNKARRGELIMRLPIGFVYDDRGKIVLDPDKQVQGSVRRMFETFRRTGSIFRTVKAFRAEGLKFPVRLYHGPRKGKILWTELTVSKTGYMLHNPRYAGAYVYGRRTQKRRDAQGRPVIKWLVREEWHTLIRDFHESYITWDEYEENLKRLESNRQSGEGYNRSAPREGSALLQGLALCGRCGKRMRVRYRNISGRMDPQYVCKGLRENVADSICQSLPGRAIDNAVGALLMEAMNPVALDVALNVYDELKNRREEADRLRYMQVERGRYEAELARRRYMRVDPDNRLVADTLEADWNARLRDLQQIEQEYERQCRKDESVLNDGMKGKIRELTGNFPRLWMDPKVPQRERKRMARLLLEDVTVLKGERGIDVHVRFKTGVTSTLKLPKPLTSWEGWTTDAAVVAEIDRLLDQHTFDGTAKALNESGLRSGTGKVFHGGRVGKTCRAYGLKTRYERLREAGMLTREELAAKQGVNRMTITKWREKGRLKAHLADDQGQYLYEDPGEVHLRLKAKRVEQTSARNQPESESFTLNKGGAV